jgi:hypothetical protein
MLLVLLAAVASGAERAWQRRQEYLEWAAYHAAAEAQLSAEARALAAEFARFRRLRRPCGNAVRYARTLNFVMTDRAARAAEHRRLKGRYLRAASCPWAPGPVTTAAGVAALAASVP